MAENNCGHPTIIDAKFSYLQMYFAEKKKNVREGISNSFSIWEGAECLMVEMGNTNNKHDT